MTNLNSCIVSILFSVFTFSFSKVCIAQENDAYLYCVTDGFPLISGEISNSNVSYFSKRLLIGSHHHTVISSNLASLMYESLRPKSDTRNFRFDLGKDHNFFEINVIPRRLTGVVAVQDISLKEYARGIDAVIGRDILCDYTIILDAFAQTLYLTKTRELGNQDLNGGNNQFLSIIDMHVGSSVVELHPTFALSCGFRMNRAEFERMNLSGANIRFTGECAVDSLEIVEIKEASIQDVKFPSIWGLAWDGPNLVGLPILNRFKIILDMQGIELKLVANGFNKYHDHSFADGIVIQTRENANDCETVFIESVITGSLAESIGLQKSDQILSIDGERGNELLESLSSKLELIRTPRIRPIKIEVLRDGQTIEFELPDDL